MSGLKSCEWARYVALPLVIVLAVPSHAFTGAPPVWRHPTRFANQALYDIASSPDSFESLGLSSEVFQCVRAQPGWESPTPIQRLAIPQLLESSDDQMAAWCEAPTGSGKTASFILPLLQLLLQSKKRSGGVSRISSLILVPTRELAIQIGSVAQNLSNKVSGNKRWNIQVIHGGVPLDPQIAALAKASRDCDIVDLLIATPGRLVDVLTYYDNDKTSAEGRAAQAAMERRLLDALDAKSRSDASLSLSQIEELKLDRIDDNGRSSMMDLLEGLQYLVIDEADRLLGRAFDTEMNAFLDLLGEDQCLQTWLFSATFPKQIEPRVDAVLKRLGSQDVVRIACAQSDRLQEEDVSGRLQKRLDRSSSRGNSPKLAQVGPASTIQLRTVRLNKPQRTQALRKLLEETEEWDRVLVFVATRYAAEHVAQKLRRVGIDSAELHGKLDQEARLRRLNSFRKGRVRVLLATDVASRGLDVVGLPAVVNYDLPRSTADFIHRVGRTGRAGRPGTAITFVTPATEAHLDLIENRHLAEPVEREVLPGFEPDEQEWKIQSSAACTSAPGTVHSSRGLAHDRMHGGIKGRRKSKKDRLREKATREAAAAGANSETNDS